jgi:hypothetical protein
MASGFLYVWFWVASWLLQKSAAHVQVEESGACVAGHHLRFLASALTRLAGQCRTHV